MIFLSQALTPPESEFLPWLIGVVLIPVIIYLFHQWSQSLKKQIAYLKEELKNERSSRLTLEAKITPALENLAESQKNLLNFIHNEKAKK